MVVDGTIYDSAEKQYGLIQGAGSFSSIMMTPDIEILNNICFTKLKLNNFISFILN